MRTTSLEEGFDFCASLGDEEHEEVAFDKEEHGNSKPEPDEQEGSEENVWKSDDVSFSSDEEDAELSVLRTQLQSLMRTVAAQKLSHDRLQARLEQLESQQSRRPINQFLAFAGKNLWKVFFELVLPFLILNLHVIRSSTSAASRGLQEEHSFISAMFVLVRAGFRWSWPCLAEPDALIKQPSLLLAPWLFRLMPLRLSCTFMMIAILGMSLTMGVFAFKMIDEMEPKDSARRQPEWLLRTSKFLGFCLVLYSEWEADMIAFLFVSLPAKAARLLATRQKPTHTRTAPLWCKRSRKYVPMDKKTK